MPELRLGRAALRNLGAICMADLAGKPRDGARQYLHRQNTVQIDRPRHRDLAARDALEAERTVIRFVADEHNGWLAGLPGCFQRDGDQAAADAEILEGGPYGERTEQERAALAGSDAGQAHGSNDLAAMVGDEGQRPLMRAALADLVGGA